MLPILDRERYCEINVNHGMKMNSPTVKPAKHDTIYFVVKTLSIQEFQCCMKYESFFDRNKPRFNLLFFSKMNSWVTYFVSQ